MTWCISRVSLGECSGLVKHFLLEAAWRTVERKIAHTRPYYCNIGDKINCVHQYKTFELLCWKVSGHKLVEFLGISARSIIYLAYIYNYSKVICTDRRWRHIPSKRSCHLYVYTSTLTAHIMIERHYIHFFLLDTFFNLCNTRRGADIDHNEMIHQDILDPVGQLTEVSK